MFKVPALATTPTVKSSESPGRKKPSSSPVSEKIMPDRTAYPSHPERIVLNSSISFSGFVSVRMRSMSEWSISRTGRILLCSAILRNQPIDDVLVHLDLSLLDQGFA